MMVHFESTRNERSRPVIRALLLSLALLAIAPSAWSQTLLNEVERPSDADIAERMSAQSSCALTERDVPLVRQAMEEWDLGDFWEWSENPEKICEIFRRPPILRTSMIGDAFRDGDGRCVARYRFVILDRKKVFTDWDYSDACER